MEPRVAVAEAVDAEGAATNVARRLFLCRVILLLSFLGLVASLSAWIALGSTDAAASAGGPSAVNPAVPVCAVISASVFCAAIILQHRCTRGPLNASKAYSLLPLQRLGNSRRDPGGIWLTTIHTNRRNSELNFFGRPFDEKLEFVVNAVKTGDAHQGECAEAIASVFSTFEDPISLADFKLVLDSDLRDIGCSLYSLVFEILSMNHRAVLLSHIEHIQGVPSNDVATETGVNKRIIVLSDMDDTLVSTFKDRRFPFNTMYPGVRQFYHELIRSGGAQEILADWNKAKEQVIFVTARPSWLNPWTRSEMQRHGFGKSVALTGSSMSFITPTQMLQRKTMQCSQVRALYPECVCYLVGDNGQRDIDLGKELLRLNLVRAVFIHDIFEPLSYGQPQVLQKGSSKRQLLSDVLRNGPFSRSASSRTNGTGSLARTEEMAPSVVPAPFSPPPPPPMSSPPPLPIQTEMMSASNFDGGDQAQSEEAGLLSRQNGEGSQEGREWVDQPVHELAAHASPGIRGLGLETPYTEELDDIPMGDNAVSNSVRQLERQLSTGELEKQIYVKQSVPDGFRKNECSEAGIVLFQSYAGAAYAALELGIFNKQALMNVATESAKDFSNIEFSRPWQRIRQREVYLRDIARISHHLSEHEDAVHFLETVHEHIDRDAINPTMSITLN
mmetsp:Transcript_13008/g.25246  ORF Transcript_13008/g.25246 Transcript_13008/m.25246 type:complete len:672 (-) Transcript_13008:57-2072(-)